MEDELGRYHMSINERGHLQVEGCDCVDLAEKYGTALFVYSEKTLRSQYRRLCDALKSRYSKVKIFYQSKANERLAIKKVLQQEGAGLDCQNLNELFEGLVIGTDPRNIMLSGVNKPDELLDTGIKNQISLIVVDSFDELVRLNEIAGRLGKVPEIMIRIKIPKVLIPPKGGIGAKEGISTMTGQAFETCKKAIEMENLRLAGILCHTGIQWDMGLCRLFVTEVMDFVGQLKKKFDWKPRYVSLGGGAPFSRKEGYGPQIGRPSDSFFNVDTSPPKVNVAPVVEEYAEVITSVLKEKDREYGLDEPALALEPGIYLTAPAGVLLTRVGDIKEEPGFKKRIFVDASCSSLPAPYTMNWYYPMLVANKASMPPVEAITDIVGPLNIGSDFLGCNRRLPKVQRGDLIAILDVGTYAEGEDGHRCLTPALASVLVSGNDVDIIRERQTVYDLMMHDRIPMRLLQPRRPQP
jgi:diaminopimelate decarboxylase